MFVRDADDVTPVHGAALQADMRMLRMLIAAATIQRGPAQTRALLRSTTDARRSLLHYAARRASMDMLRNSVRLMRPAPLCQLKARKQSALLPEILVALVNAKDDDGETALHHAVGAMSLRRFVCLLFVSLNVSI